MMSVLSYLQNRASGAVLSNTENNSISTSINTLRNRINSYFTSVSEHFQFGSSTRGTILPRIMDSRSDIDYMVVFNDPGYKPQAYLDRLKKFAEYYYSSSEIRQSSPTIILELNHIKFELVPALRVAWSSNYQIPNGTENWQFTNPNDFNSTLTAKNNNEKYLIKPTIRLVKYWNSQNGYVYSSFLFEKWIVDQSYFYCSNQRDYLFSVFDKLIISYDESQWRRDKVQRAKDIIAKVREYEKDNMPFSAESEVKKLIPE
ncbi:hypothetical protein [Asticcacaulis sp. AND118]|uniref:SMODS domain-containing nucleotidyltransferase n=1 Tax=Asticcacaulis sp. AND118 TaxID=2840468 RepID=UPI001CFFA576|nr:hypothetical protein [Asticcacaulis sp. AND118]UDF03491.1 hypothetical protein LH365_00175 [Asticcacaulis sp. AND118]